MLEAENGQCQDSQGRKSVICGVDGGAASAARPTLYDERLATGASSESPHGQEFQNNEGLGVGKKADLGVARAPQELLPDGRSGDTSVSPCVSVSSQNFLTHLGRVHELGWWVLLELKALPLLPAAWTSVSASAGPVAGTHLCLWCSYTPPPALGPLPLACSVP